MELNKENHLETSNIHELVANLLRGLRLKGKSENTLKNYKTDLNCFIEYLELSSPPLQLSDFNQDNILSYGKYIEQKYSSQNSRRRRIQTLRIFFDFIVAQDLVHSNYARVIPVSSKFVDIPKPTSHQEILKIWEHLLNKTKDNSPLAELTSLRNQLIFLLVFSAGLKVSDISKLTVGQITKTRPQRVLISPPKRDPFTVPLIDIFLKIYNKYIPLLEELKRTANLQFDELLFNSNPYKILSGGISPRGLEIIFEEIRKDLQIKNFTPKSLRQAGIFCWIHQGHKDSIIKEWLNVAPSYSLNRYHLHSDKNIYSPDFIQAAFFKKAKNF